MEHYISHDDFITLSNIWKRNKEHTAQELIIYNILRGKPADSGFAIKTKNIQGNDPWYGFNEPLRQLRWKYFRYLKGAYYASSKASCHAAFYDCFGIEVPETLACKLNEAIKS